MEIVDIARHTTMLSGAALLGVSLVSNIWVEKQMAKGDGATEEGIVFFSSREKVERLCKWANASLSIGRVGLAVLAVGLALNVYKLIDLVT